MLGFPEYTEAGIYNSAAFISGGQIAAIHRKAELPNYKVFDEKRYFGAGSQPTLTEWHGVRTGLLVCEDIWAPQAAQLSRAAGAAAAARDQRLPLRDPQAARARGDRARTRARCGAAARLREPGRWPGRAGVRRQLLRHGRGRGGGAAGAGVRGGRVRRGIRPRRARPRGAAARCHRAGAVRRGERLQRARARGARLRAQARLSRRGARALRRGGLGADARHRGGCARARAGAGRHDALALYLADEPRGRAGAGASSRA